MARLHGLENSPEQDETWSALNRFKLGALILTIPFRWSLLSQSNFNNFQNHETF